MSVVLQSFPLTGNQWPGADPFLFIAHHLDAYPAGTAAQTPQAGLAGRDLGQDFSGKDGWSMYHGESVPGFPQHPHRGFETVTVVEEGLVDHTDSAGATARYGAGDTQWLTAGDGIAHSEMFPLVHDDRPNPLHLFQIWVNLAPADKAAVPHFDIFWAERTPVVVRTDPAGRSTRIKLIAGGLDGRTPPPPPPASWAARRENHVAIWHLEFDAGAEVTLPPTKPGVTRTLYVYAGAVALAEPDGTATSVSSAGAVVSPLADITLTASDQPAAVLLLQARPIGAPVVQHGPFVATTQDELVQAFVDYRTGRFGTWAWPDDAPVHARTQTRFARYPDGRVVTPDSPPETAADPAAARVLR